MLNCGFMKNQLIYHLIYWLQCGNPKYIIFFYMYCEFLFTNI